MKILLTGGGGFVGRPLLSILELRKIEVALIGRAKPPGFNGVFIKADLLKISETEIENIFREIRPSHLIHLAWCADHGNFWEADENMTWITRTGLLVKKFCETGGSSVLITGSCAEYSWSESHQLSEYSECVPNSLYGVSKNLCRQLVTYICDEARVELSWCRIFFPYGPDEDERKFIPSLRRIANKQCDPFIINFPGSRDFLHVSDIALAIMTIIEKGAKGVINICSGKSYDLQELMIHVLKEKRADINIEDYILYSPNKDRLDIVGDNQLLLDLGWHTTRDLLAYIES